VQTHPQTFLFVENLENLGKIPGNPKKISEDVGKNSAQRCLTSKNGAQGSQKNK